MSTFNPAFITFIIPQKQKIPQLKAGLFYLINYLGTSATWELGSQELQKNFLLFFDP